MVSCYRQRMDSPMLTYRVRRSRCWNPELRLCLVTNRRSFLYPKIVLWEHEVVWKSSIKYLGVQLDRRFSFGEHLQIVTTKAIQCGANLARLMPNIGGPREVKRRLVASVVHTKLLNASSVQASALNNHAIQKSFTYIHSYQV